MLRGVWSRDTQDTEVDEVGPNHVPIIPAEVRPICSPISTHPADLGVGVDLDLVLPDHRLVGGEALQENPQFSQPLTPLLLIRRRDRPGPPVDHAAPVQHPAHGLPTGRHAVPLVEQQRPQAQDQRLRRKPKSEGLSWSPSW